MLGKLLRQFAGVAVLHGLIVLLPIVVVPHLVRQLGPDGFGRLSLALAISGILMPVLDMGFQLEATRELAKNHKLKNRLLGTFLQQRLMLFVIVAGPFATIMLVIPHLRELGWLLFTAYLYAVVNSLVPNWYFEGRAKFKTVQFIFLLWRILYAIGVLLAIQSQGQENRALWLNVLGGSASVALSAFLVLKEGTRPVFGPWQKAFRQLFTGASMASTPITASIISFMPQIVVSFLLGPVQFGYFALVDRLLQVFRMGGAMFSTLVYTTYSQMLVSDAKAIKPFYRKVSFLVFAGTGALVLILQVFKVPVLGILAEVVTPDALALYTVLLWAGVFIVQRLHQQRYLLAVKRENRVALVSWLAVVLMPILLISGYYLDGQTGTAWGFLAFEAIFSAALYLESQRPGITPK